MPTISELQALQQRTKKNFAHSVTDSKDMITTAGRFPEDATKLDFIWQDILQKLSPQPGMSLLDIGCGYGSITQKCIRTAAEMDLDLHMMDLPEIIHAVKNDLISPRNRNDVTFYSGYFPQNWPTRAKHRLFNRILIYSIIQYSSNPFLFVDSAVQLLKPGGRLLVGDIPNMSKKGRFLSSTEGHAFEATYRKLPVSKIPSYKDHHDYMKKNRSNSGRFVNDAFLMKIMSTYRHKGYDVYLLPQPMDLPMCFTREDVLVCKYD